MKNWKITSEKKRIEALDFVENQLHFQHYPIHDVSNKVRLPKPSCFYDISRFYRDGYKEEYEDDLYVKTIQVFRELTQKTQKGERMYALDPVHECYSFDARLPFEKNDYDDRDRWPIPIWPNGEFVFFLTKDFKNGIFADGLNTTISYFGNEIVKAYEKNKPIIFTKLLAH